MASLNDPCLYISKSQLRHHLQTYFSGMTDAMAEACVDHIIGNHKQIQEAEALRCPHCGEVRIDDQRVMEGRECVFCKESFEPVGSIIPVSYTDWEQIP